MLAESDPIILRRISEKLSPKKVTRIDKTTANVIDWATNKKLSDDDIENLVALCGNTFVPKLRGLDAVAEKKGMDKQLARDTFIEKDSSIDEERATTKKEY